MKVESFFVSVHAILFKNLKIYQIQMICTEFIHVQNQKSVLTCVQFVSIAVVKLTRVWAAQSSAADGHTHNHIHPPSYFRTYLPIPQTHAFDLWEEAREPGENR